MVPRIELVSEEEVDGWTDVWILSYVPGYIVLILNGAPTNATTVW